MISLNMQHGWNARTALMPIPMPREKITENLDRIADLLRRHAPDVVLLQEVDRVSPLTKKIDQLDYIARRVGYLYRAHAPSAQMRVGGKVIYAAGCGIISRFPIKRTEHVRFDPCFPTPRKGFLVAEIAVAPETTVTVVSTHLVPFNLLNDGAKRAQIDRMTSTLERRTPIIVGGDFNSTLRGPSRKHIHTLARRLDLVTHPHSSRDRRLFTYPARRPTRKIDWVFTSRDMKITDYRILRDRVSDHLAVRTEVSL